MNSILRMRALKSAAWLAIPAILSLAVARTGYAGPPKKKLPVIDAAAHSSGHRRLADPVTMIKPHYKYLVIGSGYGSSVTALRVSDAICKAGGESADSLAILERGREILPGEFPESLPGLAKEVRSSLNPLGMFSTNTHSAADMDVVGASDLGGTSTINAGITARPPDNVWDQPRWPDEIRDDFKSGVLEGDYQMAESMLKPNHGPITKDLPKTRAHIEYAAPGVPTGELTLNVNHVEGRENFGVVQKACTNCGNCCGGCNVGAKNTLTTNYLPAAKDKGANIFTQIEVERIEPLPAGAGARYRVHYLIHSKNSLGVVSSTPAAVTADYVFLGAGSAGSTEILMRSRSDAFPMSAKLGSGVSANGDVLGVMYNGTKVTNIASHAKDDVNGTKKHPVGQAITAYHDYREANKALEIEKQFLLLDGSVPRAFVRDAAQAMGVVMIPGGLNSVSATSRAAQDMVPFREPPQNGALNHSMVLLACGHDSCGGQYVLDKDGHAYVKWDNMQDETSFKYINQQMEEYAKRAGGKWVVNPRSTALGGNKMQATHPLGGAPMGRDVETGVVNHLGQVFKPSGGVYEGLHVVDAAILPHSLAAPPLITITALAERNMRHFVATEFGTCVQKSLANINVK